MLYPSLASALLFLPAVLAEGIYPKSSPVLQVDHRSYKDLIEKSNHTSIVEFYAPWCGHCKNLKPAYEKAAKSLQGLAKVAAINCDEVDNKPFCGSMGVQGFPTLKIVRPGKKAGKPTVEEYQGARTAKGIVDAVVDKIPNHVKRLKDADYEAFRAGDGPKAILFSDKGTVSALLKAIAVDFLGTIDIAQIRDKEKEAVEAFGVAKYPTLMLLPREGKEAVKYEGEMKKEGMVSFLSQAATPNPDPAPKKEKAKPTTNKSKASKASSSFSKASASHSSADAQSGKASQTAETLEDTSNPTASPHPNVVDENTAKPVKVPADTAPPLTTLTSGLSLQQKCLNSKAGTCILALLPETGGAADADATQAVASLSQIHHKHAQAKRNLFPFYQLPATNSQAAALRSRLDLPSASTQLLATNAKRSWYRLYPSTAFSQTEVEAWIDAIRMGDLPKQTLPSGLVLEADELPAEPVQIDTEQMEAMRNSMKGQLPEGVEFELEEVDDEAYERLMAQGRGQEQGQEQGHVEL